MGRRSLDKLLSQLIELESNIKNENYKVNAVSSANIGWHIEHSFLVINGIYEATSASNPHTYKRKFNFSKFLCFGLKRFPRGKVKAPRPVRPEENALKFDLEEHWKRTKKNIQDLSNLEEQKFFRHKIFGDLRLRDTIFFLELHTEHHLKIIREVVKNS